MVASLFRWHVFNALIVFCNSISKASSLLSFSLSSVSEITFYPVFCFLWFDFFKDITVVKIVRYFPSPFVLYFPSLIEFWKLFQIFIQLWFCYFYLFFFFFCYYIIISIVLIFFIIHFGINFFIIFSFFVIYFIIIVSNKIPIQLWEICNLMWYNGIGHYIDNTTTNISFGFISNKQKCAALFIHNE